MSLVMMNNASKIEVIDISCRTCGAFGACGCSGSTCETCGEERTAMMLIVSPGRRQADAYCGSCAPAEKAAALAQGYVNLRAETYCRREHVNALRAMEASND